MKNKVPGSSRETDDEADEHNGDQGWARRGTQNDSAAGPCPTDDGGSDAKAFRRRSTRAITTSCDGEAVRLTKMPNGHGGARKGARRNKGLANVRQRAKIIKDLVERGEDRSLIFFRWPLWVTCGRRLGKDFLTPLQHWNGAGGRHRAPSWRKNRKSANIQTKSGFIWGILVPFGWRTSP